MLFTTAAHAGSTFVKNYLRLPTYVWMNDTYLGVAPALKTIRLSDDAIPWPSPDSGSLVGPIITVAVVDGDGDVYYAKLELDNPKSADLAVWWGGYTPIHDLDKPAAIALDASTKPPAGLSEFVQAAAKDKKGELREIGPALAPEGAPAPVLRADCRISLLPIGSTSPKRHLITNSVAMPLVEMLPGEFMMGSPPGEPGHNATERQHLVRLTKSFHIGATEVTQKQWRIIMGTSPSHFQGDSLPVESITWLHACEFCKRLSEREQKTYRLPTEAEWEYACRAGTTTMFYFGDDAAVMNKYVWHNGNSGTRTHPVATKEPNAWGLYDMGGNVRELCSDWFSFRYPVGMQIDPTGPDRGTQRACRGGPWSWYGDAARSAARDSKLVDIVLDDMGFRVVLDQKPYTPATTQPNAATNQSGSTE